MKRSSLLSASAAVMVALAFAGCAGTNAGGSADPSGNIAVVASTTVYGDLAASVGGDVVEVTSIIDDPNKDPHEYEASAQNQLALSKAQVVIENGGGYDDFVDTMLDAADNPSAVILNAVDISGRDGGGEFNEHVWYDFPTVQKVIDEIEASFAELAPDQADLFQRNADKVKSELDALITRETELNAQYAGTAVAVSEPLPLYLLESIGLEDQTPEQFSEAVEEGTDAPPSVLLETIALMSGGQIALLAYNEQTTGPQTEQVLSAAEQAGVAVVPVTETLPDGLNYTDWMTGNLDAIQAALES